MGTHQQSFPLYTFIIIQAVALAKADTENCNACPCMQTDTGKFAFLWSTEYIGIRRAIYLCLDFTKNMDKNWNINVSFIIIVNFDHAGQNTIP